jgi:hypothetical protein
MVGLSGLLNRLWTRRTEPRIMLDMDGTRPIVLWTPERLALELRISRQAVHNRIKAGTLIPHYIVLTSGDRPMYLFDPSQLDLAALRRK